MEQKFYSHGKLLITGEYLVLDGALALALPTKFRQDLVVSPGSNRSIFWQSFDADASCWFMATLTFDEIIKPGSSADPVRQTLLKILHEAYLLEPGFLAAEGYKIETQLTFPRHWGLGTSSTLINNIAQWTGADAFALLANSFGGSGYDIACAQNDAPVLYRLTAAKPSVKRIAFDPDFKDRLYFVYLNRKQNSKKAIENYRSRIKPAENLFEIDALTLAIANAATLEDFADLLEQHEKILSAVLGLPTVKESLFADFDGVVKSLGAWGGDFVLAVASTDPRAYFIQKGFHTVIPYAEMIL